MQSLNVLIVCTRKSQYIEQIKNSKYLNKLYITSEEEIPDTIRLQFNTFKELAQKCRTLQIDIVLVEEEKWILEGIATVMKQFFINCFAITTDWAELGLSHNYARKKLTQYGINVPPIIKLPLEFPVIVKGDGILKKAHSMQEIISIKEKVYNTSGEVAKNIFLEKYLNGEKHKVISLFDGKHLLTFPHKNIRKDLSDEYSKNLERMLIEEKAKFIGFINSDIVEEDGILYNTGFSFEFTMPDFERFETTYPKDILYFCLSAMYQKLDEIDFSEN